MGGSNTEVEDWAGGALHQEVCDRLVARFPYMFEPTEERSDFFEFSPAIGHGWLPIFVRLCEAVDGALLFNERQRFRWHQVKEKFGGLRAYWGLIGNPPTLYLDIVGPGAGTASAVFGGDDDVTRRVMPLIRAAEKEAANTCERCGVQPASIDSASWYLQTLCAKHRAARRKEDR